MPNESFILRVTARTSPGCGGALRRRFTRELSGVISNDCDGSDSNRVNRGTSIFNRASSDPALSAREQLERLRAREAAWTSLSTEHMRVLSLREMRSMMVISGGGIIVGLVQGDVHGTDVSGDLVPTTVVKCCTLPQPWNGLNEAQYKTFMLRDIPFPSIVAYDADPEQDLLIVLTHGHRGLLTMGVPLHDRTSEDFFIQVLSLADGSQHSDAMEPILCAAQLELGRVAWIMEQERQNKCTILIRGPVVMAYGRHINAFRDPGLHFFNWRTGASRTVKTFNGPVNDATFISERDVLVFLPREGIFEVLSIGDVSLSTGESLRVVARFHLPALREHLVYKYPVLWDRPIVRSGRDGVVVASARVCNRLRESIYAFDIVIRIPDLLKSVRGRVSQPDKTVSPAAMLDLPWGHWGTSCTRILDCDVYESPTRAVSGYRVAYSLRKRCGTTAVYLFDFNPRATGWVQSERGTLPVKGQYGRWLMKDTTQPVEETRTCVVSELFVQDSVDRPFGTVALGCIPYRVSVRSYDALLVKVYLDEDHLITLAETLNDDKAEDGAVYSM
ncbi:hypothetical protein PENSPDRAFT_667714 [Peniophora sp. CONT]|nr:hypothetical protein PENSPDRAFT_667714 [Peniophora sp. CONT]